MILVHMGGDPEDVEFNTSDEGQEIILKQGDNTIKMTPEGARSLAFVIIGATDRDRGNHER